ncbi:MAG: histidine phosphatase family protein [Actinomycetota bacterium]|nr:histidine phosphatase family protein [Actinomycetota bacterium]
MSMRHCAPGPAPPPFVATAHSQRRTYVPRAGDRTDAMADQGQRSRLPRRSAREGMADAAGDDAAVASLGVTRRFLIVQHGEKERQAGDPGLTDLGRSQAQATAAWVRSTFAPARIVSSPLRRAVETATPIAAALGCELTTDDRLRERMNWHDADEQTLDGFLGEWHRSSDDRSFVPRLGNSSFEAADRFITAMRELALSEEDGAEVVLVTHGGVTVDALRSLLGDDRLLAEQPDLITNGVPCCAVTKIYWNDDEWRASLPSAAHLVERSERRPA